jgi:hypothetical protein
MMQYGKEFDDEIKDSLFFKAKILFSTLYYKLNCLKKEIRKDAECNQ